MTCKRSLCGENGFSLNNTKDYGMPGFVHDVVRNRNWIEFSKHPQPVVIPIVREFYANFHNDASEWVVVRGIRVHFNSRSINNIL